jgi:hypothetical protein
MLCCAEASMNATLALCRFDTAGGEVICHASS